MAYNNQAGMMNQSSQVNKSFFNLYFYQLLVASLVILGVGAGVGYWYYQYRTTQQQLAQRVYAEALDEYMRGVDGAKDAWANLESLVDISYKHHASSTFGPYFLVLKAEALLWQDQLDRAIDVMQEALSFIAKSSPLYFPYKTKLALMLIDSAQKDRQEKGVVELQKLVEDPANTVKDNTRYALASYYLVKGDKNAADALLNLIIQEGNQDKISSPWVMKAKKIMRADA